MTMTASLTDRYVDAAMRTVPERQRADLSAELRVSIEDQIDARMEAGESRDSAEYAVLTQLGDPEVLAAGYTDRPLWLVGPRYFLDWWRLLKLLLAIVPVCAAFGVALGQTLSGATVGAVIGTTVAVVFQIIVHLAFWTTLVFVVLERTGHETINSTKWTPEQLPEPRPRGAGLGDLIGSLVFLAIAVGVILWDHFIGLAPLHPGVPLLDDGLWPWWITGLFVIIALEALLAIAVYASRGWTYTLAVSNGILNAAVALPALWLLFEGRLINPDFWPTVAGDSGAEVHGVLSVVVGFVIAGIAIWSTADGVIKAARGRN
ncbi:permease prefix domain 1-containing protein [Microbacterium immunditiarum]|uniref:Uncharacterized protein n=1 Tax=Microbacterium immunditiarum TaxID=337480 RepID=A0A7Y9GRG2_9MICO|nr:permease prefix domain 1-containing protein [Microbacterium immunditiarum]NYE21256.1 hypothetical protein [Microbacterium immunditiarum]